MGIIRAALDPQPCKTRTGGPVPRSTTWAGGISWTASLGRLMALTSGSVAVLATSWAARPYAPLDLEPEMGPPPSSQSSIEKVLIRFSAARRTAPSTSRVSSSGNIKPVGSQR